MFLARGSVDGEFQIYVSPFSDVLTAGRNLPTTGKIPGEIIRTNHYRNIFCALYRTEKQSQTVYKAGVLHMMMDCEATRLVKERENFSSLWGR